MNGRDGAWIGVGMAVAALTCVTKNPWSLLGFLIVLLAY